MSAPTPSSDPAATLESPLRSMGFTTGTLLVVANMVGVGVFTTTGFLMADIKSAWAVLAAWLIGGLTALCGALAYAELGAALPHNGGEFQFLTRIYHPAVGFSAGAASLVVGFAAPLASFGLVFGSYLQRDFLPDVRPEIAGLALLVAMAIIHTLRLGFGHGFQNWATMGKLLLILGLIGAGVAFAVVAGNTGVPLENLGRLTLLDWKAIQSKPFAVGLIYVSFSYAGWNAAGYVAGEIRNPTRTIPRTLLTGTLLVTVLYCALNWAFLISVPASTMTASLASKQRVAGLAGEALLGPTGGRAISFLIMAGLVATTGALTYTGARVTEALGQRYRALGCLALRREGGGPVVAIVLQLAVAIGLLLSARIDTLLQYTGFTLILFNMAVVAGVFVLRRREPNLPRPYRMWGYPVTPLLFLAVQSWVLWNEIRGGAHQTDGNPMIAVFGFGTVLTGVLLYFVVRIGGENRGGAITAPND